MRNLILGTAFLSMLTACEQQDVLSNNENLSDVLGIEAEISAKASQLSRTSTTEKGNVAFAEGDAIGFFMPESDLSGSWTLSDGSWSSDAAYVWPDVLNTYDFCAYYPFVTAESRTEISMPDLKNQNGTWENLSQYDFLAARCKTNYKAHNGTVPFTGDEAFKHVYALVSVTLKGNNDTKGAVLSSIHLQSDDLVTAHTYHFGETTGQDGMGVKGEHVNEFLLDNLSAEISTKGYNRVFIVNPLSSDDMVTLTVNYTRDMKTYTASTQVSGKTIQAGSLNNLTIRIKKSGLVVEGNTVQDWVENTLPEQDVDEIILP